MNQHARMHTLCAFLSPCNYMCDVHMGKTNKTAIRPAPGLPKTLGRPSSRMCSVSGGHGDEMKYSGTLSLKLE